MTEFRCLLAGARFRPAEAQAVVLELEPDATLDLVREPENPYDPNAIQVHSDEHFIGFVAKQVAEDLAPLMDAGESFTCRTAGHQAPLMPYLVIESA